MQTSKQYEGKIDLHDQEPSCKDDDIQKPSGSRKPCHNECKKNKQCVCDLIESIALLKTSLAHILNAEGEKIQKAVKISKDINELLEVNRSVTKTILSAVQLEQIYLQQLDEAIDLCKIKCVESCKPKPRPPEPPCPDPKPSLCTSMFCTETEYLWTSEKNMQLKEKTCCSNGITLCHKACDSMILLPAGKKYKIEYRIELLSKCSDPVSIDMKLCQGKDVVHTKNLSMCTECKLKDSGTFVWETPAGHEKSMFSIWLVSPSNVKLKKGKICISETQPSSLTSYMYNL